MQKQSEAGGRSARDSGRLRVGLVVPHIFLHKDILPRVIFSPGKLALELAEGLQSLGAEVTLFSPGPADTSARNITADLSLFEKELAGRDYDYIELLKKHPLTFISLARQAQAEVIARAFRMANDGQLDVVHIYTNEEDIALPFAALCSAPVVFTHHDPFNFLVKYKNTFPKFKHLNWISMSLAQRRGMPPDTNWIANIHHGLDENELKPNLKPRGDYAAYLGRIVEPKGVHLAIEAIKLHNAANPSAPLKLKIAGKHYAGHGKDEYWREKILPELELGSNIEYVGFIGSASEKQDFLGNAKTLIVPSIFEEPFGMVSIEALACATPVIGLDSGAIPEVVKNSQTGFVMEKSESETATAQKIAAALAKVSQIERRACRADFEQRFTLRRMCQEHFATYQKLLK